jgi:predicted Zn-dependent peptidase
MRKGGAGDRTAIEFDERADFLAANLQSFIGPTSGGASVNALSHNLGESLDLLFDMLARPRFEESRLGIEKGNVLESMKQRNDDAGTILTREWGWLMSSPAHFSVRPMTNGHLDALTREELAAFHGRWFRPENVAAIAISGDVDTKAILAELERRFAAWKPEGKAEKVAWPPPIPNHQPKPGVYHVEKDIPQGKVYIGHLGTTWKDPDHIAGEVMNDILGGGGFTSRITKRVRSDEGLAYSAGSGFNVGQFWPGQFRVSFQSKSATVAFAAQISLGEVEKIRREPVAADELETAKNSFIDTFPRSWESAQAIAGTFASDELLGRPHTYWERYQDNVRRIGAAEVQRAAQKYLKPDQMVFLVVGKWADIEKGDPDGKATMKEFGAVTHLPVRDPLTLEPLP